MTPGRDPFGRALSLLRQRLRGGGYASGESLTVVDLARDLGLSPTPVREALSRLAGEGLIEDRRGRGYFTLRMDVADLQELYQLNLLYLSGALDSPTRSASRARGHDWAQQRLASLRAAAEAGEAQALFTEALFEQIAAESYSRALISRERRVADVLAPIRRLEPAVIEGLDDELGALARLYDRDEPAVLLAGLRAYHQRRREMASAVINAMKWRG
jgi:DNA-binding GntR family transcriptional regulator